MVEINLQPLPQWRSQQQNSHSPKLMDSIWFIGTQYHRVLYPSINLGCYWPFIQTKRKEMIVYLHIWYPGLQFHCPETDSKWVLVVKLVRLCVQTGSYKRYHHFSQLIWLSQIKLFYHDPTHHYLISPPLSFPLYSIYLLFHSTEHTDRFPSAAAQASLPKTQRNLQAKQG